MPIDERLYGIKELKNVDALGFLFLSFTGYTGSITPESVASYSRSSSTPLSIDRRLHGIEP